MLERYATSHYKVVRTVFFHDYDFQKKKKKKKVKTVKMCILLKRVFSVIGDHLLPVL